MHSNHTTRIHHVHKTTPTTDSTVKRGDNINGNNGHPNNHRRPNQIISKPKRWQRGDGSRLRGSGSGGEGENTQYNMGNRNVKIRQQKIGQRMKDREKEKKSIKRFFRGVESQRAVAHATVLFAWSQIHAITALCVTNRCRFHPFHVLPSPLSLSPLPPSSLYHYFHRNFQFRILHLQKFHLT